MIEETRQHLSQLILDELAEEIKSNDLLRTRLEDFTDLPVEKVAQAIIKQFEYLLSSELRDLIIHLIEQDITTEQAEVPAVPEVSQVLPEEVPAEAAPEAPGEEPPQEEAPIEELPKEETRPSPEVTIPEIEEIDRAIELIKQDLVDFDLPAEAVVPEPTQEKPLGVEDDTGSIMEHFAVKEPFPTQSTEIKLDPADWLYFYGFTYAPNSTGKGEVNKRLDLTGIEKDASILLMDYGDIRVFLRQLQKGNYAFDKIGKPTLTSQKTTEIRFEHERILNILRSEEVVLPLPFWSILQGQEEALRIIEKKYVEILRSLIDAHDAVDWDVDVMVLDDIIMQLPEIADSGPVRAASRTSRHQAPRGGRDIRKMEKVIFREKSLAQEIHNELLVDAAKNKIDYMVRLDSAIMGDWKSILSARYQIGKDKRRQFCQTIATLQDKYSGYQLMFKTSNPISRFSLVG